VTDDFRDVLAEFVAAGVRFLVVGAHALAAHGVPRVTGDLDLWVEPTAENAARVWHALAAFGAPLDSLGLREADFVAPDRVVQLGLPPLRIDLLTSISGVGFAEAWPKRVDGSLFGVAVAFLGRDELIANKRASGRPRDRTDIEALGNEPSR
jgi:hypothetical protein